MRPKAAESPERLEKSRVAEPPMRGRRPRANSFSPTKPTAKCREEARVSPTRQKRSFDNTIAATNKTVIVGGVNKRATMNGSGPAHNSEELKYLESSTIANYATGNNRRERPGVASRKSAKLEALVPGYNLPTM